MADKTKEPNKVTMKNLEGIIEQGVDETREFWTTGHFYVDFAITQGTLPNKVDLSLLEDFDPANPGGMPKGMVVEIFGEPGGGKSSLCLRIVGNAQRKGAKCLWVDREQSFVPSLARINGVDTKKLYMMNKPALSAEEVFHHLYNVIKAGEIKLIVVDSVAALIPKRVMENTDPDQQNVALLARVMGACIPKLTALCAEYNCTCIFINQIRQKPGVMFGPTETTPGGDTLKFFASVRLEIRKKYSKDAEVWMEDENGISQLIAQKALCYIRKTRFSRGLREGVEMPVYFATYFPFPEEVAFDAARQIQVIKVREGVFSYTLPDGKKITAEGRKNMIDEIVTAKALNQLIVDIREEAPKKGVVLPPELISYKIVTDKEVTKKESKQSTQSKEIEEFLDEEAKKPQEADDASVTTKTSKGKAGRVRTNGSLD